LLGFLLVSLPLWGLSVIDQRWPSIEFAFEATFDPSAAATPALPGGVVMRNGRVHRAIQDAPHKLYFGYDVVIEGSGDGSAFQIRAEPLSAVPGLMGMNPAWHKLALPYYPVIPEIRVGATVKLYLLVNPETGQKIVDSITIKKRGVSSSPTREFSVADADLTFSRPQLRVDGMHVATDSIAAMSGPVVWFYVANRGRFTLTLAPHPELGFQRIGEVSGGTLTIRDGATLYEFECQRPIAPGSGTFFVYVRREPTWKPPAFLLRGGAFTMGANDGVNRDIRF
jgi:hypothetical protein